MCRVCKQSQDGRVDILKGEVDMGDFGTLKIGTTLWNYYKNFEPHINTWAWFSMGDGRGECLKELDLNIKYCPFCGRRIERGGF